MTRGEARQEVIERWEECIIHISHPAKKKVNNRTSYVCSLCGHGENGDGLTINPKGKKGSLICFGCGFSGDIIDFYQRIAGVDYNEALEVLTEQLNIQIDNKPDPNKRKPDLQQDTADTPIPNEEPHDYTEYYKECRQRLRTDPAGLSYLSERAISKETAWRYWLGYDPAWKSPTAIRNGKNPPASPRLIMPINSTHYEARDTRPDHQEKPKTGPDFRKMKEGGSATFNRKALYAQDVREVFVTEGVIDALSVIEAGGQAVGLTSANRAQAFIDELIADAAAGKKAAATFILCLDNDEKGRNAEQVLSNGLQKIDSSFLSADIRVGYKDPNEALQKDRAGFVEAVHKAQAAARKLTIDSGEADIDEFFDIVTTEQYKAIPTGIDALDKRLSGGFLNEWLVIINAAPGAGKTVLASQICENMARSGRKCLYFNFEMSKEQLIARSLARIVADDRIGAIDILRLYEQDEQLKERAFKAGLQYKQQIAPNMLYNPDRTGPDLDRITATIEARAIKAEAKGEPAPIVCVDYLQMIEGAEREDAKAIIKRAVYAFKKYAEQHHTIVICISAQSRAANNDDEARQDAGRDTSNIEYSADLQLQIKSDKDNENIRQLYITKSRFAQPSLKHHIDFEFYGKQGRFVYSGENKAELTVGRRY